MDSVLITLSIFLNVFLLTYILMSESASSEQGYVKPAAPETDEDIRGF